MSTPTGMPRNEDDSVQLDVRGSPDAPQSQSPPPKGALDHPQCRGDE
eukprot:CAMPEP_0204518350 /NCGR_PEP_ID=MMETSP0661-20131031/4154_1 /ASSEMBLY_ACC=CAM_ASM_000606 /TAXON_ID=109239 /ORGANISM="Alexandrium margalefi, Strain AMGDE01CS-322" /LENGTH=46 /DNA_ID= /DNA_START= /DNA_END= /DNA_ORIENTATION=